MFWLEELICKMFDFSKIDFLGFEYTIKANPIQKQVTTTILPTINKAVWSIVSYCIIPARITPPKTNLAMSTM